ASGSQGSTGGARRTARPYAGTTRSPASRTGPRTGSRTAPGQHTSGSGATPTAGALGPGPRGGPTERSSRVQSSPASYSRLRPPVDPQLDDREREQHREEGIGQGTGIAHLVELERRLVDIEHHGRRPVDGTSLGHDEDLRED